MHLSSKSFTWLNPVPGTEFYARQKAGGILAMILMVIELVVLAYGAMQCSTISHWILCVGTSIIFLFVVCAIISSLFIKEQPRMDCDLYHELFLMGALWMMSQVAFAFGVIAVLRGYPYLLPNNTTEVVKILSAVDWVFAVLSMFIFGVSFFTYIFMSTREVQKVVN